MSEPVAFAVPPVVKTVTVRRPPEIAFRVFTENLGAWWPLATHHVGADPRLCGMEPRLGGRLFERAGNGAETHWGTVQAWEPPHRVAFSWHINVSEAEAQRVEVTFTAIAGGTEVRLTHSGWEKLGARAQGMRDAYDRGWAAVFGQHYADHVNTAA